MASTSADSTRAPRRVRQRAQAQLGEAQHEQGHALLRIEDHGRRLVNELRAQEEAVQADAAMLNQQTRLEINIVDARLKQVEMDSKRLQALEAHTTSAVAQLTQLAETVKAMQLDGTALQQQVAHLKRTMESTQPSDPWT